MRSALAADDPGVALVDIDTRARLASALLRRADMIDVVVRDDHRRHGPRRKPERLDGVGGLRPVIRVAGVDQSHLALVHEQVEVHPLGAEPEDAVRHLSRLHSRESPTPSAIGVSIR
jgi:hypothetical protein